MRTGTHSCRKCGLKRAVYRENDICDNCIELNDALLGVKE